MKAHLSFEEMTDLIFAAGPDAQYFQNAARINAHLHTCVQCARNYRTLLVAHDRADALRMATRQGLYNDDTETDDRLR